MWAKQKMRETYRREAGYLVCRDCGHRVKVTS